MQLEENISTELAQAKSSTNRRIVLPECGMGHSWLPERY
jgi:hypothetical protein